MLSLDLPPVDPLAIVAALPCTALGAVIVVAAVLAYRHDPGRAVTPEWTAAELRRLAAPTALVLPTGEHQVVGRRACDQIASTSRSYVPRHDDLEIPPSVWYAAMLLSPVERAKALTAELGNWAWRPARPYRTGAVV